MRQTLCTLFAMFWLAGPASVQEMKAYSLQLGDTVVEMNLGETVEVKLPDGTKTAAKLTKNPFASYAGGSFSFVHPSDVAVTRSDLGDGVIQHLEATALGTIVIVQEYANLDPTSLNQLMLEEMTRDGVAAGAEVTQQPAARQTPGGKALSGLTATETGTSDVAEYEIVSYGASGAGVLVVTRIDRENLEADGPMLAKFWESFEIK